MCESVREAAPSSELKVIEWEWDRDRRGRNPRQTILVSIQSILTRPAVCYSSSWTSLNSRPLSDPPSLCGNIDESKLKSRLLGSCCYAVREKPTKSMVCVISNVYISSHRIFNWIFEENTWLDLKPDLDGQGKSVRPGHWGYQVDSSGEISPTALPDESTPGFNLQLSGM